MEVPDERRVVTEGLWIKCDGCKDPLWKKDLEANFQVCPKCNHHYKISAYDRIDLLMDPGWSEHDASLYSTDPLNFKANKAYKESLKSLPAKVGVQEAVVTVQGTMNSHFRIEHMGPCGQPAPETFEAQGTFTGSVLGKTGSFRYTFEGTIDAQGNAQGTLDILPGTGTGGLVGLRGEIHFMGVVGVGGTYSGDVNFR